MLGIIFSLLPLIGWGIGDYISSRMSKSLHPAATNLFYSFGVAIPTLVVCLQFGVPDISIASLLSFVVCAFLLSLGFIFMLQAFSTGATGIVAPIANAYAIITLGISVLFLGLSITPVKALGVFIVVFGIIMLSYEKKKKRTKKSVSRKSTLYAFAALGFFGVGFASFEVVATQEWYQNAAMFQLANAIVAMIIYAVWLRGNYAKPIQKVLRYRLGYMNCIVSSIAAMGLFLALDNVENVAIPAAIAAASPLVTIGLARYFDHEKLSIVQRFGAVVVVSGIVLLSL